MVSEDNSPLATDHSPLTMNMPYIGIDFGTSNSVVANFQFGQAEVLPNHEGQKWTPSVVTLRRDGTLAFGQEAKENFDEQRSIRSIKRILGTPERVPLVGQNLRTEQIAVMLFSLLKRDAEAGARSSRSSKAVVTIPANSKGLARHATKLCAGAAGLQVLTLINEPTAAAICYGLNAQDDQTVLVYDFGGGTLDVTILRIHHGIFEEVGSKGIGKLGGDDIDAALATYLAERFQEKTGYDILNSPYSTQFMLAVERAKIDLSGEKTAVARRRRAGAGAASEPGGSDRPASSSSAIIMPLIVKSGTAIDEAMSCASCGRRTSTACCWSAARARFRWSAGTSPRSWPQGAGAVRQGRSDDLRRPGGGHRLGHPAGRAGPGQLRLQRQAGAFALRQPDQRAKAGRSSTRSSSAASTFRARSPRRITRWPTRPSA